MATVLPFFGLIWQPIGVFWALYTLLARDCWHNVYKNDYQLGLNFRTSQKKLKLDLCMMPPRHVYLTLSILVYIVNITTYKLELKFDSCFHHCNYFYTSLYIGNQVHIEFVLEHNPKKTPSSQAPSYHFSCNLELKTEPVRLNKL